MSIIRESFSSNLLVLRILGLYPPLKYQKLYKIYAFTLYFICIVMASSSMMISLIITKERDITKLSDNLFMTVQLSMFIFKLFPLISNSATMQSSVMSLEAQSFQKFSTEHPKIMNDCAKTCRIIFWIFFLSCFVSVTSWGLKPISSNIYKLPIDVWFPFDPMSNSTRYFWSYVYIFTGVGHGALVNGALDPLVAGLACQAAGQFRILKNNLEHLPEYVYGANGLNLEEKENSAFPEKNVLHKRIISCIEHHNAILDYVKHYEDVYAFPVFCQFSASVFVICISTYDLSMVEPLSFAFFQMSMFIMTMLTEIFLYSYFGTVLREESDNLTTSIYLGKWYDYDIKSRKLLIILMERSKKPVRVTAGKILDLSLVTFTTILRRAYSLFAVLNSYDN